MNVRRAKPKEAPVAADILEEATAFVATLGFPQWPTPFPVDELAAGIERGELYLAELDGEIVGTFTLLWDDPSFWGEQPPVAVYLHKLAIRRRFAGRGLGAALVDWVGEQAAAAGRRLVRLDCLRDDHGIRSYYERLGFEHRGDLIHPRFAAALYERPVPGRCQAGARQGSGRCQAGARQASGDGEP